MSMDECPGCSSSLTRHALVQLKAALIVFIIAAIVFVFFLLLVRQKSFKNKSSIAT